MAEVIITFIIALIGALVAVYLKIPAGQMVGAMISVAIFNLITDAAYFPAGTKIMTQIISGLFIGCGITRSELNSLKRTIKPAIINVIFTALLSLIMAVFLYYVTDYSFSTCAFAGAPGGLMEMTIMSMDMKADSSVVSILQTIRILSIIGLFPTVFKFIIRKIEKEKHKKENQLEENQQVAEDDDTKKSEKAIVDKTYKNILMTLVIAVISGSIGYIIGMPAGTLIFTMIGVGIQNITTNTAYMPKKLKQFAQVCAGALIGASVNRATIISLRYAIIPAVIMVVGFMIMTVILAYILYKTSKLDMTTALFACAPGGASDMTLIAGDLGASAAKVSIVQTMRLICVIMFYPLFIQLISMILS